MVRVLSVSSLDLVNTSSSGSSSDQVYENVTIGDAPVSYWDGSVSVVIQRNHNNNKEEIVDSNDNEVHESEDSDCASFEMMMIPDFSSLAIGENLTNKTDEYQTIQDQPSR